MRRQSQVWPLSAALIFFITSFERSDSSAVKSELDGVSFPLAMALIHQTLAAGRLLIRATQQDQVVRLLQSGLHRGEAERIVLGLELSAGFVLMDKKDGRKAAERTDRRVTGVLGVLLRAKDREIPLLKPAIEALRTMAGFYVLPRLEKEV
mgnify:CR=1 FL=1